MGLSGESNTETTSIDSLYWVAAVLVAMTGASHIYAGFIEGRIPVLLAGVGYFGGLLLFQVWKRRRYLYLVGIVYTFVQLPLWYVVKAGEYTLLGYVDKTVQIALIGVLAYLYWTANRGTTASHESLTT